MRRAAELALVAVVLAGCGGGERCPPNDACAATRPPGVTASAEREVAFRDESATTNSPHDGAADIEAVRAGAGLRITAYQGTQRSGGHAIRIERITRVGDELRVHAGFATPATDALVTMALTSPAHTVSVDEFAAAVILYDTGGVERARTRPR